MIKKYTLKNGETRYRAVVYLGKDPVTNKDIQKKKSGFKSYREAQLFEARLIVQVEEEGLPSHNKNKTYNEVFKLWWEFEYIGNVKESTSHKTSGIFENHILPAFGEMLMEDITPHYCQQVVNAWRDKLYNFKVVKNYANRVFEYAIRMDLMKGNPFDKITMPARLEKIEESEYENFYTKEELNEFLECVKNDLGLRWYAYFRLLAYSGLRLGEGLSLLWKDIDFQNGQITVNKTLTRGEGNSVIVQTTKTTNGRRVITIDEATMNILKQWKYEQASKLLQKGINISSNEDQIVFSTIQNEYINPSQPYARMKSIQKRNGLRTDVSTHGLRHTHISLLFEAGASIQVVQNRVGHTDVATTMNIYTHVVSSTKRDTADRFANYMEN